MQLKLISFEIDKSCLPSDAEKGEAMESVIQKLRGVLGVSMASALIAYQIEQGRAAEVVATVLPAVEAEEVLGIKMINIPPGKFQMGSADGHNDEKVIREVSISAFRMAKYPVTNERYKEYLEDIGGEGIPEEILDPEKANHPVVNVTWHDAVAYCKWLSEKTGRNLRLPTEAEWEYVARGTEGRTYPWGNEWDATRVAFNTGDGTRAVDLHDDVDSPFGVKDLSGNVLEWCSDWYADSYDESDIEDPKGSQKGEDKVLRGGSWREVDVDDLRGAYRDFNLLENGDDSNGFRVAEDL